jgi:hypothetical protein
MTNEEFTRRYRAAHDADTAFELAVRGAGFKSRWEMPRAERDKHPAVVEALNAKIAADASMHDAWEEMRLAARLDREYGPATA